MLPVFAFKWGVGWGPFCVRVRRGGGLLRSSEGGGGGAEASSEQQHSILTLVTRGNCPYGFAYFMILLGFLFVFIVVVFFLSAQSGTMMMLIPPTRTPPFPLSVFFRTSAMLSEVFCHFTPPPPPQQTPWRRPWILYIPPLSFFEARFMLLFYTTYICKLHIDDKSDAFGICH